MYNYEKLRPQLFLEENQALFLDVRDRALHITEFRSDSSADMLTIITGISGSSWLKIACVDRMVELGELVEIGYHCDGQDKRLFKRT
jgi:hypothetical protein